jgi:hypothetical protein
LAELRLHAPDVKATSVHNYLTALVRGGYVRPGPLSRRPLGGKRVRHYELIRDVGVDAPRLRKDGTELPATAQQHMWLTMKIVGNFTAEELALYVSSEERAVPVGTAESYIRHLEKAGYLASAGTQGKAPLYRLIRNTGGYPPVVQRASVVFDPNLGKIMWHEEIEP